MNRKKQHNHHQYCRNNYGIKNTPMTTTNNFPSFSDFSRLAMEEAIVKKIKGIIAVKVNLKIYLLTVL
jgi:hypothetical protein